LEQLGRARQAVLQQEKAVDGLLDIIAFDLKLISPSLERLDLTRFLAAFAGELREWARAQKLPLVVRGPRRPLWVATNPKWLRVLFYELLSHPLLRPSPKSPLELHLTGRKEGALLRIGGRGPAGVELRHKDRLSLDLAGRVARALRCRLSLSTGRPGVRLARVEFARIANGKG
jgi:signal transduction histidine kinase